MIVRKPEIEAEVYNYKEKSVPEIIRQLRINPSTVDILVHPKFKDTLVESCVNLPKIKKLLTTAHPWFLVLFERRSYTKLKKNEAEEKDKKLTEANLELTFKDMIIEVLKH